MSTRATGRATRALGTNPANRYAKKLTPATVMA